MHRPNPNVLRMLLKKRDINIRPRYFLLYLIFRNINHGITNIFRV